MGLMATLPGFTLLVVVLWDTFETVVLPRSVTRSLRLTRVFYRTSWALWSGVAKRISHGPTRDAILSFYGPLSLLMLMHVWALCLIVAFALIHWGLHSPLNTPDGQSGFSTYLYMSGVTLFTLGFGDVVPREMMGRALTVAEAGVGIGFLALVIGYLPTLYQAFSRREVAISLLDARAGSPPTAVELLRRHGIEGQQSALIMLLQEWERWAAELLESHLSFPVLLFYRSQHDRESWLAALTAMLDTCSILLQTTGSERPSSAALRWQANVTFAMCRHAVVDLALILNTPPSEDEHDRLSPEKLKRVREVLLLAGFVVNDGEAWVTLRRQYEPYLNSLSRGLMVRLPPYLPESEMADNWQTSAWKSVRHF